MSGKSTYYVAQVVGWAVYGVLQYLLSTGPHGPALMASVAAWCGTGMVGTHLLRMYLDHRRWQKIPQLVLVFAVAALLIPLAMDASRSRVNDIVGNSKGTNHWLVFAHYFQAVLVISVWCAVFLTANEVRRRRQAEMEALRLALVAQVSQFHALRSQLNPHFLFNCLNSLRELIEEDRQKAKQMVDLLSELLRYTLQAGRVDMVTLGEELRAVEDYLLLEKIRFEERLQVHYDIDPNTLSARLPPMILQTMAENGVKHGIANLPEGGDLFIVTRWEKGCLRVEVVNTGSLSPAQDNISAVGLDNARERLRLLYKDRASLALAATDQGTVRASILIPANIDGVVA